MPDMRLGPITETVDEETGELCEEFIPVKPTHFKEKQTGTLLPVEDPDVWVYVDGGDVREL